MRLLYMTAPVIPTNPPLFQFSLPLLSFSPSLLLNIYHFTLLLRTPPSYSRLSTIASPTTFVFLTYGRENKEDVRIVDDEKVSQDFSSKNFLNHVISLQR